MTNLQAALGVAQMEELPEFIHSKQKNYGLYQQLLQEFSGGTLLSFREGTSSNQWFYSLKLDMENYREKHERCDYNASGARCADPGDLGTDS